MVMSNLQLHNGALSVTKGLDMYDDMIKYQYQEINREKYKKSSKNYNFGYL